MTTTAPEAQADVVTDFAELEQYQGKKFEVTIKSGDGEETLKATLLGSTPSGAVFNLGRKGNQIVKPEDFVSFVPPEDKKAGPKVKVLKPVTEETVAQHLLDRHGVSFERLEGIEPGLMVEGHTQMHDPKNGTLGHRHSEPKPSEAEQAVQNEAANSPSAA